MTHRGAILDLKWQIYHFSSTYLKTDK